MRVLRDASFEEVQQCFRRENQCSNSFDWTNQQLVKLSSGQWKYVLLARSDILMITTPSHSHGRELEVDSTIRTAVEKLPRAGECWDNVTSHRNRDFSETHVFLQCEAGQLAHLDGFHRLLAWVIFDKEKEVPAYVVWA